MMLVGGCGFSLPATDLKFRFSFHVLSCARLCLLVCSHCAADHPRPLAAGDRNVDRHELCGVCWEPGRQGIDSGAGGKPAEARSLQPACSLCRSLAWKRQLGCLAVTVIAIPLAPNRVWRRHAACLPLWCLPPLLCSYTTCTFPRPTAMESGARLAPSSQMLCCPATKPC